MKINLIDISRLDLNLAVIFLAVWEERSVTKAAQRLALSQSALSSALTRLRNLCGDVLFVRTKKGMEPTSRAQQMADQIAKNVEQLWQGLKIPQAFTPETAQKIFTIGLSDDFELAFGAKISSLLQRE